MTLTLSTWISPLVPTVLQPLVMFRALSFCQLNPFSWKAYCSCDFMGLIRTRPCGVTGEGEEIILMVIQDSWGSKGEKKTLTDLAEWPLQILFSQFAFFVVLHSHSLLCSSRDRMIFGSFEKFLAHYMKHFNAGIVSGTIDALQSPSVVMGGFDISMQGAR